MNAIGGYFELELSKGNQYHVGALCLNTAHNCLEYVLLARKYKKLYIPYYTCDVVLKSLQKCHVEYEFYSIDVNLEPIECKPLQIGEGFLYTNYFGLKQSCVEKLSHIYKSQLIVDNAQAFFALRVEGIDTLYSPRKFFGVPDGGYLYTDCILKQEFQQDSSYDRVKHLLLRIDKGAETGYLAFKTNEYSLSDMPIMKMSNLTQRLLAGINYKETREKRVKNFITLHGKLKDINLLKLDLSVYDVPMIYPFYCEDPEMRKYLIDNKIFVAMYWPNVLEWCSPLNEEYSLCKYLIPLPIDQRYDTSDMEYIAQLIKAKYGRENIFKSFRD